MRVELLALGILAGLALASMGVHAATGAATGERARQSARRGSFVLGSWVRGWFYWAIGPVERPIVSLGLAPEIFNGLGLLLGLGAMAAFATAKIPLAGYLLLLSGLADVLDGVAARARDAVSPYGAFLDSTLDRFAEVAMFVGIAAFFRETGSMLIVLVAMAGSLLVSYARARGESLGVVCKVGALQRAERLLLLGFGSILDPTLSYSLGREPGFVLFLVVATIAAGTMGTAIFRTIWISRRLRGGPDT